jgi:hypothetical protein
MNEQDNRQKRRDRIQGIRDAMNQSMGVELGRSRSRSHDA